MKIRIRAIALGAFLFAAVVGEAKPVPATREPASIPPPPKPKIHGLPFYKKSEPGAPMEDGKTRTKDFPSMFDGLRPISSVDRNDLNQNGLSVVDLKGKTAYARFARMTTDTSNLNQLHGVAIVVLRGKNCASCDSEMARIRETVQNDPARTSGISFLFVDPEAVPKFLANEPFKSAKDKPDEKHSAFFVFERQGDKGFGFQEEKPASHGDPLDWARGFSPISPVK